MGICHMMVESTRLVSLMAQVLRKPSYGWVLSLALSTVLTLTMRTGAWKVAERKAKNALSQLCRGRDAEYILRYERVTYVHCRVLYTYPRFLIVVALAVSRLLVFGFKVHPFLSHACMVVAVFTLGSEIIGDLFCFLIAWLNNGKQTRTAVLQTEVGWFLAGGYHAQWDGIPNSVKDFGIFDPLATFLDVRTPGVRFAGSQLSSIWEEGTVGVIGMAYTYCVMWLLVGAGFLHGYCETWVNDLGTQVIDGLVWESPLYCA